MTDDIRPLHLTQRELELVLKYGYPFPEQAGLLRSCKVKSTLHVAHIDSYWISMWIADIVRSAKKIRGQSLLDELDALCDVSENAERHDLRVRGLSLE
ncbi:MAG: hypothetical protein ACLQFT_19190 [Steroidobacteraceae bacterium]